MYAYPHLAAHRRNALALAGAITGAAVVGSVLLLFVPATDFDASLVAVSQAAGAACTGACDTADGPSSMLPQPPTPR